ncbi:MAG: YraN family protein [Pseudomonadota bacterium]
MNRHEAERQGRGAERRAAWLLRAKGYRILESRFKTPVGEVDLIARRGSVIAFVEVKMRGDLGASLEAVTARQRHRIARAAEAFLKTLPEGGARFSVRFDLIALAPGRLPRHVADAWRPGG